MEFKKPNSEIFMLGARKDELGGSVYYQMMSNAPQPPLKLRGGEGELFSCFFVTTCQHVDSRVSGNPEGTN